jgi:hypothetical protein
MQPHIDTGPHLPGDCCCYTLPNNVFHGTQTLRDRPNTRDSLITTLHTYITASCGWAIVWFQCGEWQWYQTKIGAETSAHMPIPHTGYSISCNHDPVENIICCGAAKQVMGQLLQMEGRALHCGSEGPYIRRAQEEFLQTPGYHGV